MKPANSFLLLLTIWVSSFHIKLTSSTNTTQNNIDWYKTCSTTVYTCGDIANISFPFWGGNRPSKCGYPGLNLTCNIDDDNTTTISMKDLQYHILEVNQPDHTLTLARSDLISNICVSKFVNTTLDYTLFKEALGSQNMTILYGCTPPSDYGYGIAGKFNCTVNGTEMTDGYVMTGALGPSGCKASVVVPTMGMYAVELQSKELELDDVVEKGFKIEYVVGGVEGCGDCEESGGMCGYDREKGEVCVCSDGRVEDKSCGSGDSTSTTLDSAGTDTGGGKNNKVVIGIGIGAGLGVALLLVGSWSLFARRRKPNKSQDVYPAPPYNSSSTRGGGLDSTSSGGGYTSTPTTYQSQQSQSMPSYSSSDIEKNTGGGGGRTTYFGVRLFTYNELEQATNNFDESKELGDGGFGTVYYGQLPDGQPIAVKRLYENSFRRVEQSFMNEIEILAKLRHDHLVTLYGCTSRHSRDLLLVYEYVSNGTVADHLHGKRASSGSFLSWPIRLAIATETAEALLYLHRSDIIHRDVKTPNILLDGNFRVKVADFGLSRLFPNDVSHVSTAPQGTPGYVDPEYFQCYRLTEKSDVYSFGVVLVELVSSKQAVDITRHRHDINLSNMAIDRIKSGALGELVDERLGFDGDQEVERGVRVVCELAFRCLQQEREMRPSMEEIVEGLRALRLREESFKKKKEGSMDLIDVSIEDDQSGQIGSFRNTN